VAVFPRLGTISGGATKLLNSDTGGGSSDDDDDDDDEADFFFVGITDIITTYYRTASLISICMAGREMRMAGSMATSRIVVGSND
jgi:hypothetical protein